MVSFLQIPRKEQIPNSLKGLRALDLVHLRWPFLHDEGSSENGLNVKDFRPDIHFHLTLQHPQSPKSFTVADHNGTNTLFQLNRK